jgi:hypothetical protein
MIVEVQKGSNIECNTSLLEPVREFHNFDSPSDIIRVIKKDEMCSEFSTHGI